MPDKGRPDIIFVMLDTVRADYLKTYGGSANFDTFNKLSKKGALYTNAISAGTYTAPSHTSLFLGKRVTDIKELRKDNIKCHDQMTDPFMTKSRYIKKGEMTLARKLSYLGYESALFSNNPFVSMATGMAEGFDHIENAWIDSKLIKNKDSVKATLSLVANDYMRNKLIDLAYYVTRPVPKNELNTIYMKLRKRLNVNFSNEYGYYELDKGSGYTNSLLNNYLMNENRRNKFIFINYMEAHEGYPTNLITKDYVEQDKWFYMCGISDDKSKNIEIVKKAYIKRLEYLDTKLNEMMRILKERGMLENSVVVMAGDHGQAFMEHNVMYHNMFPYNEMVHVPLLATRFIGGKQVDTREVIEQPVSLSNLHGSLLDIGYSKSDVVDGSMTRPGTVITDHVGITEVWDVHLLKRFKNRIRNANIIYKAKRKHNTFATAVYHKGYKLIHYYGRRNDELYKLDEDSLEQDNMIGAQRDLTREMLNHARA